MKTHVTRPFLPPLQELLPYLEKIWERRILTNKGPFHKEFEADLSLFLGVDNLSLFTNGTIALVTALQTLKITGEVITTPYSFVATAHSLIWNNLQPVFVDVNSETCNLDPGKIESAITSRTTAILPVHCYGNPCDVKQIQTIADIYGLKIIYDAAHAFGVQIDGESILKHGDLSILSFHATKVFNTFEGGAIVSHDVKNKQRIDYLKNFGFADEVTVMAPGINGKMNEFSSALGILQLRHYSNIIQKRKKIDRNYRLALGNVIGIRLISANENNYAYFPIFVEKDYPICRDRLYEKFRENNIFVRRYFYPLISEFPVYRGLPSATQQNLKESYSLSRSVICLPIFPELTESEQNKIIDIICNPKQ